MDDTVKMANSSSHQSQRFSVESFKFVGEFPFVYLHCSVVVCKADDPDSRCSKGCIPGLHVNPPYAVVEKQKEQSQHRDKREVIGNKDPEYMISRGPFSLSEATVDDSPDISLRGPQQDQSTLAEDDGEKERQGETLIQPDLFSAVQSYRVWMWPVIFKQVVTKLQFTPINLPQKP